MCLSQLDKETTIKNSEFLASYTEVCVKNIRFSSRSPQNLVADDNHSKNAYFNLTVITTDIHYHWPITLVKCMASGIHLLDRHICIMLGLATVRIYLL